MRYADILTLFRILLTVFFVSVISFYPHFFGLGLGLFGIFFIILLDGLDGIVARKYDTASKYGSFFDIVGDRIVEILLLVPFIYLRLANPLFIIYYVTKDFIVDYIRFVQYDMNSKVPFSQTRKHWAKLLVSSRFMRAFYGFMKIVMYMAFYVLIFYPNFRVFADIIALITILVSLLRTLPVVFEFKGVVR